MTRPRAGEPDELWPGTDYPHTGGLINSDFAPVELTEKEKREERRKRREALARKKPLGFAPWPESSDDG